MRTQEGSLNQFIWEFVIDMPVNPVKLTGSVAPQRMRGTYEPITKTSGTENR